MEYTKERLHELELAERKLNALEAAGVDNWTYYDDALKDIRNEEDNKMKKDQLLIDLETELLKGVYEPSEHGAGFCATKEARDEARNILDKFLGEEI